MLVTLSSVLDSHGDSNVTLLCVHWQNIIQLIINVLRVPMSSIISEIATGCQILIFLGTTDYLEFQFLACHIYAFKILKCKTNFEC